MNYLRPRIVEPSDRATELADADALLRVSRGETSALAIVYERHRASIHRFVAHATNHAHDVEDLVHATFLTAARASHSYDGREDCRPWLLGIAARLLQRRRRALGRWSRVIRDAALRSSSPPFDPVAQLGARDDLKALAVALMELSEGKRLVVLLSELEGLSGEEIATTLGIPVRTVWTRLHHARRDLRARLSAGRSA